MNQQSQASASSTSTTIDQNIILRSVLWFTIPGLWILFNLNVVHPWLVASGMSVILSFHLSLYTPLLVLLIATLVAYRREGGAWNWRAFARRMRLTRMTRRDWAWAVGGLAIAIVAEGLLEPTQDWLASLPLFTPSAALPAPFNPDVPFTLPPTEFMGTPLRGNWWVIGLYSVAWFLNIAGEELAWRGYLLPRQEQKLGKWAWLFNGLLWVLVLHVALRWMYISLLPTGLLTPLIAQHRKNTWVAIIIHGVPNGIFIILLILGVMGISG